MRLYFFRHGLADRSAWDGEDYFRPLTPDGINQILRASRRIVKLDLGLDQIITSPLIRAKQTAEIAAEELGLMDLLVEDKRVEPGFNIYHLAEILQEYPDADALMLVGHEPDFSTMIERLIGGGTIVCKKGSLARVDLVDSGSLSGELVWLIPPKALIR